MAKVVLIISIEFQSLTYEKNFRYQTIKHFEMRGCGHEYMVVHTEAFGHFRILEPALVLTAHF
jgi:hypothetical protein